MEKLNKKELVSRVHAVEGLEGLSLKDVERVLVAYADVVLSSAKQGVGTPLVGLGHFSLKENAARTGRNPQTGEPLEIKASRSLSFKVGKNGKHI